jgi:hypothetical protein
MWRESDHSGINRTLDFPLILLVPGTHLVKQNITLERKAANVRHHLSDRTTSHAEWWGSGSCGFSNVVVLLLLVAALMGSR